MKSPDYWVPSALEGISWPAIAAPQGASMLAMQFQLEQSQWWSPEQLQQAQLSQARLLLQHALKSVPFYRDQAAFSGFDTTRPFSLERWSELPLLQRATIQRAGKTLLTEALPKSHGKLLSYHTSGSTGQPLQGYDTEVTRFFWGALNLREHLWHKRELSACFAAIRTKVKQDEHPNWGGAIAVALKTGPAATLNISTPIAGQLKWLIKTAPAYLLSHASNLKALAQAAIETGTPSPGLQQIISFGEMLPPDLKGLCAQAWPNAALIDMYSSEELGYLALQCPEHPHYHVQAENLLLEVIDDRGKPCQQGEIGRVVVTTLHNFGMPFVRYRNGDLATTSERDCPCRRGLPLLERIDGRRLDMIRTPDGRMLPGEFFPHLFKDFGFVR
ncbi:MAG: phenylacetate--CoA ligase family protein, partial [Gammaproteobacteria bacterium]|nr:phenylacetate--CoA ligase family protein [Gammaproteobacteria bacterium]